MKLSAALKCSNRSLALVVLVLSSCADDLPPNDTSCGTSPCDDASTPDIVASDDVPPDEVAANDVPRDAPMDSPRDIPSDNARDAPADAALDAGTDVAIDAPADVQPDAPVDAPIDLPSPDVRDAVTDVAVDVRPDVTPPVDVPVTGGCVSGATGTYVARFRWTGSGPGSRASVSYEANTLPDHARWHATANSMSIGFTPVYDDTFLGPGGLALSGTVFMDIELSTVGIGSLSNVTIALFGRSFNTTASGSFAWRTFRDTGAAPSGLVANSAPYQWYRADATTEFTPGDGSVLLRITAGPPSGSLVVNRVEVCFDAR